MIDRHRVAGCSRFLGLLLATCATKDRLYYRSGLWVWRIEYGNSVGVILNHSSARIAAYLWACMAFVIYLEYKCHERQTTVRFHGQQTASGLPELRTEPWNSARLIHRPRFPDRNSPRYAIHLLPGSRHDSVDCESKLLLQLFQGR
jgi:hypothetical protein